MYLESSAAPVAIPVRKIRYFLPVYVSAIKDKSATADVPQRSESGLIILLIPISVGLSPTRSIVVPVKNQFFVIL